ncbi:hypothetical protein [Actinoplanes regularis]|uniref:hypothetical protein n=1 Tax=Actinoplanes regularis TaxID=52697 RepID=UPI00117754A7|nr:hypothetical protein [Actinoplanes regularis]GIE83690.1 hypothetical protein Are01nite_01700 [Actinoplanes regularis]
MAPNDDLGHDDGHISADITAMEDFARNLLAYVDDHYAPHADNLANQLLTRLPAADGRFNELAAFVGVLEWAQDSCQQNIYNFANGAHGFAKAAEQVSGLYRGSDAFARARLADVESALVTAGLLPPGPGAAPSSGSPPSAGTPADLSPASAPVSPSSESSVPFDASPSQASSAPSQPSPTPSQDPSASSPPSPTPSQDPPASSPPSPTPSQDPPAPSRPASPSLSPWASPPSTSSTKGSA